MNANALKQVNVQIPLEQICGAIYNENPEVSKDDLDQINYRLGLLEIKLENLVDQLENAMFRIGKSEIKIDQLE